MPPRPRAPAESSRAGSPVRITLASRPARAGSAKSDGIDSWNRREGNLLGTRPSSAASKEKGQAPARPPKVLPAKGISLYRLHHSLLLNLS